MYFHMQWWVTVNEAFMCVTFSMFILCVCVCVCVCAEVKINIGEGVKFAQDICNGMTYLHSLETLITKFDLSPHHVFVSQCNLFQQFHSIDLHTF